jgi:hypothetical protein
VSNRQSFRAAFIVFANGDVHPVAVKGDQRTVNGAEADVLRFNAAVAADRAAFPQ